MSSSKKRLREIAARNPGALPAWLRRGSHDEAWYRTSWQTAGGIDFEAAARPAFMVLDWFARRGLLTRKGVAIFNSLRLSSVNELAISRSMVGLKAAAFLDQHWESWWESHGVNLVISREYAETAYAGLQECWRIYGTEKNVE